MSDYPERHAVRVTEPASEPLSLSEVKSFLRIDGSAEDTILTSMIRAARLAAEAFMGKSLITQGWQLQYVHSVPERIALPYGPVQSITSVLLVDREGNSTAYDAQYYYLNAVQELVLDSAPAAEQIRIIYQAGYGASAAYVPSDMIQSMLIHIAHLYAHRDSTHVPMASQLVYGHYRPVRL